jgi:AraC family transcriptional regulator
VSGSDFAPVPVLRRELVQELQLEGLRFTESWHRPSSTIARHAHRCATVTILADGSFEETYPTGRALECIAPAVHVRPPGEPHVDRLGATGAHNLVLEVDDLRFAAVRSASSVFDEVRHFTSPEVVRVARAIQRELSLRADASALVLEGLALELLGESGRESTAGARDFPAWLRQAREELDDRFQDPRLRLGELAAAAGVHPVHLARAFRRHFGASPGSTCGACGSSGRPARSAKDRSRSPTSRSSQASPTRVT